MTKIDPTIEAVFGPIPEGIDINHSTTKGYNIISCVVLGLSTAAVVLRLYVRSMHNTQTKNLGIDDYTILLGLICTGALVATTVIAGSYGSGKHVWSSDIDRLMVLLKVVYAEPWVYAASVTSTKVSILLLYHRIFFVPGDKMFNTDRLFFIMFWSATFFACTYPIIMWTVMASACRPISFYWRQYAGATDGTCIEVLNFFLIFGIINMVNDIIILVVPIPRIIELHMNARKKASVTGIMLLGSFVCIASIVRIYYLHRLTVVIDVTWTLGPAFGWSSLEPSIAIISACLPTFAPLFRGLRNKISNSSDNDETRSGTGYQLSRHASRLHSSQQVPNRPRSQSHFSVEDDEAQLVHKSNFRQTIYQDSANEDNSEVDHAITVKTQYSVVTTDI